MQSESLNCLIHLSLQLVSEQQESRPLLSPSIDDFLCETKCDGISRPVTSNTAGTALSFHSVQLLITQNTWGTSTISWRLLSADMLLSTIWDLLFFYLNVSDVCYLNTHVVRVLTYTTHIFTWGLHATKEQDVSVIKLFCVVASNALCLFKSGYMFTIFSAIELSSGTQTNNQMVFLIEETVC